MLSVYAEFNNNTLCTIYRRSIMPNSTPQFDANNSGSSQPRHKRLFFVVQEFVDDEPQESPAPSEVTPNPPEQVIVQQSAAVPEENLPTPPEPEQSAAPIQPKPDDTQSSVAAKPKGKRKKKAIVPDTSPAANDRPLQTARIRTRRQLEWPDGNASDARQDE
jgi:hypothetical protein